MQRSTSSFLDRFRTRWWAVAVTYGALLVAGAFLVWYLVTAIAFYQRPFLGVLTDRNLTVVGGDSLTGATWPGREAGLRPGDRLVVFDGLNLDALPAAERRAGLFERLDGYRRGETVTLTFLRDAAGTLPEGADCVSVPDTLNAQTCTVQIMLQSMPAGDWLAYFGLGWISGGVLWLLAAVLFVRHPRDHAVQMVTVLASTLVIFVAGYFDSITSHVATPAWRAVTVMGAGLLVTFALEFPYRFAVLQPIPALGLSPLVVGVAGGVTAGFMARSADAEISRMGLTIALGAQVVAGGIALAMMWWRRARSASVGVRNQSMIVVFGLIPALLAVGWWFGGVIFTGDANPPSAVFAQVLPILLPLSAMFAVLQFRSVDTDRVITRTASYGALLTLGTLSYFLVVAGIAALIGRSVRDTALNPALIVFSVFVLVLAVNPLRLFLQRQIDAIYFRTRRAYQPVLEQFSRDVTNAVGLNEVMELLLTALEDTLAPTHVILFMRDPVSYEFRPQPDPRTGERPTDIVFRPESGLVRHLRDRSTLLHLEEGRPLPLEVVSSRSQLAVLRVPVIAGLRGRKGLNAILAIGPRGSGLPYLYEDLRFIESLSDHLALAVERAQAVDDLERRVQVQDVLSQVSRALNFAIDFDTLLELIYAQTLRVIDAPCFYIALRDPHTDELYYVFYNEGDDRIAEMEGKRWRMGRDLMSEIARTQATLRTDDYVRESLLRDPHTPPDNPNLKAWMGVPLLADTGEGVLGVMVAATTEPGVTFSDDQQDLFWDIANLAASALDKLQLFEKTQQRARQLAAINEIANQLASEMGNVDRLLQLITENAVQILNAEAGSLLLVNEETDDLEFRVVVGGGGQDLIGTRLPAGSGLAGATVQRGEPIIVNDPARDSRWYGDIQAHDEDDAMRGDDPTVPSFRSGAILSVPLLAGGRAIGVLQVLNKQDGSIFVEEDAEMLATFAGQAAIAIENARLFDMTDQQLALRVQELDTMQRIDSELNRTLDLGRVVDITMDWALRKSGASAGALFMRDRERNEFQIIVSYGYPPDSPFNRAAETRVFPADWGVLGRVVRMANPSLFTNLEQDPDYTETLPDCVAQITVPLISAGEVIGVIILESDREGELDLLDLDFVSRLAEHATPAIVNAQLFQELQRANEAKSEFVSFVAHELKNPMTSMKGYTDLLLKGVVGPINEQQSDFLRTIFSNVARMETLVSDLNDLTKQQTNNLRLEIDSISFREVLDETLRAQRHILEEKEQKLVVDVPEDLPLVAADRDRLLQILTNFVSNANKYTPAGGRITIQARATRNVWNPQQAAEVIHCMVQDTGIGMSEEDMSRLFTPYFRSENPKTREQPGTGLGLAITRGLIELHGGTVWVESELGVGSTFHFTLPVAAEPAPRSAAAHAGAKS